MNYNDMSLANKNKFGKIKYHVRYTNTAQLNATKNLNVPITNIEKENYAPFTRVIITNLDTATGIMVYLNGVGIGDDTINTDLKNQYAPLYIPLNSIGAWTPPNDEIAVYSVDIYCIGAGNIAANKIIIELSNY